ncbi:MAG: serine/threonine-protein phosphatase [Betaproteobacteria bacterium]|nr:serine/threonine-protein phosphatase [Betaproteobacteria bacterium]MDE2123972.1 serine/threonine-protein phosphatase [Betaproteobacteria bacterium]MDE2188003.1 serine/threonine-protein phosphatase [Betaproteobacteria bacterium]MDE2325032.1 serine/threonine-protein phosphatase [Betaproteobacteria bacterium]
MKFSVYQVSRRGARMANEDRMGYCYTHDSVLLGLADGMGGHPRGDMAAQLALQTIAAMFQREAKPALDDVRAFLRRAILAAHEQIQRYAKAHSLSDYPRTTVVLCVLQAGVAQWAHVGDSRLYFLRNGALLTRTRDHSHAEQRMLRAVRESKVLDATVEGAPINRNVLYTCLGSPQLPFVEIGVPQTLRSGDMVMLCSDGLWSQLPEATIVRLLSDRVLSDAVPEMVELALRQNAAESDNVTALAMEWEAEAERETTQGVSTEGIRPGVFASTFQSGLPDMHIDELDDAAIERSIAEINEAIRRAAAKK